MGTLSHNVSAESLAVIEHGVIYRSGDGWQGYYGRVVKLTEREYVASMIAGTACETADSHPEILRSQDGGRTWRLEGPVERERPAQLPPTETGFISRAADGTLVCVGARWEVDPANPAAPLVHPQTLGMRENRVHLRRSADGGRTWSAPREIPKPFDVPLELPTGLTLLEDGSSLFTCATWRRWDGVCPYGHRVAAMRSRDGLKSWEPPVTIFHDPSGKHAFWEGRVAQLDARTLLATCWAHQWDPDEDLPNHYAISRDNGLTWSKARVSPVKGQTGWPLRLAADRILFVYNHRRPPVGVRAQIARLAGEEWTPVFDAEVWSPENRRVSSITQGDYAVCSFQFGQPSALWVDDLHVMVVYWCVEEGRAGINRTLIRLGP